MKKIKKIKIKSYSKKSGKIITMSFDKKFPIAVKRTFFLYDKKGKIRGDHAHKKCSQFFYPILGKFLLKVQTHKKIEKILLSHIYEKGLLIPPKYWVSVKFLSKNSSLMVVCDKFYNANDYIHNFNEYLNFVRKK
jgi:dTDP-4-dehydrorhamnose 3,5-epimerase-like enzyme